MLATCIDHGVKKDGERPRLITSNAIHFMHRNLGLSRTAAVGLVVSHAVPLIDACLELLMTGQCEVLPAEDRSMLAQSRY